MFSESRFLDAMYSTSCSKSTNSGLLGLNSLLKTTSASVIDSILCGARTKLFTVGPSLNITNLSPP